MVYTTLCKCITLPLIFFFFSFLTAPTVYGSSLIATEIGQIVNPWPHHRLSMFSSIVKGKQLYV